MKHFTRQQDAGAALGRAKARPYNGAHNTVVRLDL